MNQKIENPKMVALRLRLWQRELKKQNLSMEELPILKKVGKRLEDIR